MDMERKVGEIFEYDGHKLKVVEEVGTECHKCFLFYRDCKSKSVRGFCNKDDRTDNKNVIFVEAKDEQLQQQAGQSQELNLCEILNNCPKGTEIWSDDYGTVKFVNVGTEWDTPIEVELTDGQISHYTEEGWHDKRFPASCLLWPSKDCRDWSKFTAPWLKKERFNPNTLKPFDKVLVRFSAINYWKCDLLSHIVNVAGDNSYVCVSGASYNEYCIPYNEETKHLVGTKEEAPEFYKYWED